MKAKQLSVFIENRKGRLGEVLSVLKVNGVNILSLSLADTTEYGLLRLIVDDSNKGREKLKESGFSSMLTDVLIVKIDNKAGSLENLVKILSKNEINVEYMYALSVQGENAYIVLKASDPDSAEQICSTNGITTVTSEDVAKL